MATISENYNWFPANTCSVKTKPPIDTDKVITTDTSAGTATFTVKNIASSATGTSLIFGNGTTTDSVGIIKAIFFIAGYTPIDSDGDDFIRDIAITMTKTQSSTIVVGEG